MLKIEQAEFWTDLGPRGRASGRSTTGPTPMEDYLSEPSARGRGAASSTPPAAEAREAPVPSEGLEGDREAEEPLVMAEPVDALERRLRESEPEPVAARVLTAAPRPGWGGGQPSQRFNMARFLTLTGSLDTVEDVGRWMELPRRGIFRSVLKLGSGRRFSKDFLRDIHAPPRAYRGVRRRMGGAGGL